jgi:hypothetical protein
MDDRLSVKRGDSVGEMRATVRLTNAADRALVHRNLMRPEEVHSLEADALIDTGAVSLILPSFVVERLGLARPFKQVAEYADGRREEVDVTEPVNPAHPDQPVLKVK